MIDIVKIKNVSFTCPYCESRLDQSSDLLFTGIHVLWDIDCEKCAEKYYMTLPMGHTRTFPIVINKRTNNHIFSNNSRTWLAEPLIKAIRGNNKVDLNVKKRVFQPSKNVVILNCLDYCFGHVFWKLLNAQRYLDQNEWGLVLVIPEIFSWLIPDGVHEVWLVDTPLAQLNRSIEHFDDFIKNEIKRFENVRLSKAFVHMAHDQIDLSKFVKVEKFNLDDFDKKPVTITYVLRQDRFWFNNSYDQFLYLVCLKFGLLHIFSSYFIFRQTGLINRTAALVRKSIPGAVQVAVGIGSRGRLKKFIKDLRTDNPDICTEKKWCETYSKSHIVLGVHGSNMIIPTGLAAGFIEIIPDYKIPHITEDITFHANSRFTLFLGRHLENGVSPRTILKHLTSMIERFPYLKLKTEAVYPSRQTHE